jgi:hypothetical protein
VPETQGIINGDLGVRWFVIIIIVFWLSTLIVANILDRLFTWLREFRAAGNSLWETISEPVERVIHGRQRERDPALD